MHSIAGLPFRYRVDCTPRRVWRVVCRTYSDPPHVGRSPFRVEYDWQLPQWSSSRGSVPCGHWPWLVRGCRGVRAVSRATPIGNDSPRHWRDTSGTPDCRLRKYSWWFVPDSCSGDSVVRLVGCTHGRVPARTIDWNAWNGTNWSKRCPTVGSNCCCSGNVRGDAFPERPGDAGLRHAFRMGSYSEELVWWKGAATTTPSLSSRTL
jgi:hypothetical protein